MILACWILIALSAWGWALFSTWRIDRDVLELRLLEILRTVDGAAGRVWLWGEVGGSLFSLCRALNRLEASGSIVGEETPGTPERGGRPGRRYRLAPAGMRGRALR